MANDRVFIRCRHCGGWKMLLKFFPSTGSTTRDNNVLEWLDAHADCHPRKYEIDLNGDPGFDLYTEDGLDPLKQNYIPDKQKQLRVQIMPILNKDEDDVQATYRCLQCGGICEIVEESVDYTGTHCTNGNAGTHYTGDCYSLCCLSDFEIIVDE
jgi:DNA-directed RNA polymerase subunit RPC12/RpoP